MLFNDVLGMQDTNGNQDHVIYRTAVRAVVVRDGNILLIHSNKGDYKLPGGGVEIGENHTEALLRELAEETGYVHAAVGEKIGVIVERYPDLFDPGAHFQMTSYYYRCELLNDQQVPLQLDGYEKNQQYTPEWLTIPQALGQNQSVLDENRQNRWLHRENFVLTRLLEMKI